MNQIIQEPLQLSKNNSIYRPNSSSKVELSIEFSNEIAEIPYGGNYKISMNPNKHIRLNEFKNFIKQKRYYLQFLLSCIIASIFLIILFLKLYQNHQQEKIAKELLNNYQLTTLYSDSEQYNVSNVAINTAENPFVIGMIKIDKIELNYPILSESNDELLKISLCRFTGPMPNEVGNLCIAGHNYIDNSFFSRLNELEIGDLIEVYGLYGQKQEYYVYSKYEVEAEDLSCASQDVGENRIVTLLTCDNADNNKRLIIQAKPNSAK